MEIEIKGALSGVLQVILIRGGFMDADMEHACAPGTALAWQRQPTDTRTAFRDRAIASALGAGVVSIVFGGVND